MANRFYERLNGTKIRLWQVVAKFDKDTLSGDVSELTELLSLSDGAKEQLIEKSLDLLGSNPDPEQTQIENFDESRQKLKEQYQDLLDYWDMDRLPASGIEEIVDSYIDLSKINQGSGALIYSVCGEDGSNPSGLAVDGKTGTHWQHSVDELHSITIDLNYPKTIGGIRFWIPNDNAPFQLRNVVLRGSQNINMIDNENNLIASGIDFTGDGSYSEYEFVSNKKLRYLKLENISTDHGSNTIRIREIELKSIHKFYDLEGTEN